VPAHVGVALLLFDRLESAARAVQELRELPIAACDLMDRRHLGLARESDVRYDLLIPAIAEAALVVEIQAETTTELREHLTSVAQRIRGDARLAIDARHTLDPDEREFYWRLATRVVPRLHRLKGSTRPLPFVEDVLVPPEALPEFLVKLQNVLKRHEVTASLYGHVGHGRLHVRPFLDLLNPHDVEKMQPLAEDFYDEVLQAGGWIGGELGDGLSRTPYLARQSGPMVGLFRTLKTMFDPGNLLNPGKIVGSDGAPGKSLLRTYGERPVVEGDDKPVAVFSLQLNWSAEDRTPGGVARMADACNGCGACRSQSPGGRMCPMFRFLPREEASPRAKANLMRAILSGTLAPESLATDEFKLLADSCVNCQQCRAECPAGVDVCKLMVEAKAAYVAQNGLRPSDWLMTRLDLAGACGGIVSGLANWALANRQARWVLEKLLGIAHGRKLPRVARKSFLRRASRRRLNRSSRGTGPKVLYFVDTFANYYDPDLAEAFVAVLEHNGVSVYAPGAQAQSGMAAMTMGAVDVARRFAKRNVSLLADAVRQGYEIVATEPAAAHCLSREYPTLLDDDETRLVAANTSEACSYLWRMHRQGKLQLDFKPMAMTVGYHAPCMMKALDVGSPGENLLRLVPGLFVDSRETGCSGMAGTFGLKRENFRNSLRAGWDLVTRMRAPAIQAGATECSSCRVQMEQGTTKPTLHPIKILAIAYGLTPHLDRLLTARGHDLLLT
jgi:Fe-S oxidoreductase